MADALEGIIHGKTIQLTDDPGLADGQRVEVKVRPVRSPEGRIAAIQQTAGALAHLPAEDWEALDEIIGERQRSGRHRGVVE
jgi:hypothetical protein